MTCGTGPNGLRRIVVTAACASRLSSWPWPRRSILVILPSVRLYCRHDASTNAAADPSESTDAIVQSAGEYSGRGRAGGRACDCDSNRRCRRTSYSRSCRARGPPYRYLTHSQEQGAPFSSSYSFTAHSISSSSPVHAFCRHPHSSEHKSALCRPRRRQQLRLRGFLHT